MMDNYESDYSLGLVCWWIRQECRLPLSQLSYRGACPVGFTLGYSISWKIHSLLSSLSSLFLPSFFLLCFFSSLKILLLLLLLLTNNLLTHTTHRHNTYISACKRHQRCTTCRCCKNRHQRCRSTTPLKQEPRRKRQIYSCWRRINEIERKNSSFTPPATTRVLLLLLPPFLLLLLLTTKKCPKRSWNQRTNFLEKK